MRAFLLVFLCVALNVSAQLLLKKGAAEKGQTLLDDGLSPAAWLTVVTHLPVLAGLAIWTIAGLLWILVLAQLQLSHAYALYGFTYVLTPILAVLVFAERISPLRATGTILAALGVIIVLMGRMHELSQPVSTN